MSNDIIHPDQKASEKAREPFLGLLMLDTNFPRYIGDIANERSFPFPLKKKIITGATPDAIINGPQNDFLAPFIAGARELAAEGAKVITTSCGFLTPFQNELQNAVPVPVLTSSLFLHNQIRTLAGPDKKVGILTIAASSLSAKHLAAANIPDNTPIGTTEQGREFTKAILENRKTLDFDQAKNDNVEAALALKHANPDLDAILLECTNMPPYADAIRTATGLPVFSIIDGLKALWKGDISGITLQQGAESDFQNSASREQ